MDNSEQVYESNILKIAINKYLDKNLQKSQKNLQRLEANKDEIVWDIVSAIYNQSGYKVTMSFARDVVDQRIKDMKEQLKKDEEKAHQEMITYQKMMKIKAEQEKAYQEITRIKAEEEKAYQEKIRLKKEREITNFIDSLPKELNFDKIKLDVFIRVHKLCCEHYFSYPYSHKDENDKLDDEEVFNNELFMKIIETQIFTTTLYQGGLSNFTKVSWPEWDKFHTYKQVWETYSGDSVEAMELFMALEEEFEIEIADEESENLVYMKDIVNCIYTKITTS
jgi:acyl carrier protein